MFYEHGFSGGMLGAPQHSASCFPGTCRHESYAQFGAYMGKFDAFLMRHMSQVIILLLVRTEVVWF